MEKLIQITIEDKALVDALKSVSRSLRDLRPLMRNIAGTLAAETERNFAAQGRPRWQSLQRSTLEGKVLGIAKRSKSGFRKDGRISKSVGNTASGGFKLLQSSGSLASSLTPGSTDTSAYIGTNKIYARIHQFGGKTKARKITPRNGRVLAFGGKFARSVNHPGSSIPARPYLPMTAEGRLHTETAERILETVMKHMRPK